MARTRILEGVGLALVVWFGLVGGALLCLTEKWFTVTIASFHACERDAHVASVGLFFSSTDPSCVPEKETVDVLDPVFFFSKLPHQERVRTQDSFFFNATAPFGIVAESFPNVSITGLVENNCSETWALTGGVAQALDQVKFSLDANGTDLANLRAELQSRQEVKLKWLDKTFRVVDTDLLLLIVEASFQDVFGKLIDIANQWHSKFGNPLINRTDANVKDQLQDLYLAVSRPRRANSFAKRCKGVPEAEQSACENATARIKQDLDLFDWKGFFRSLKDKPPGQVPDPDLDEDYSPFSLGSTIDTYDSVYGTFDFSDIYRSDFPVETTYTMELFEEIQNLRWLAFENAMYLGLEKYEELSMPWSQRLRSASDTVLCRMLQSRGLVPAQPENECSFSVVLDYIGDNLEQVRKETSKILLASYSDCSNLESKELEIKGILRQMREYIDETRASGGRLSQEVIWSFRDQLFDKRDEILYCYFEGIFENFEWLRGFWEWDQCQQHDTYHGCREELASLRWTVNTSFQDPSALCLFQHVGDKFEPGECSFGNFFRSISPGSLGLNVSSVVRLELFRYEFLEPCEADNIHEYDTCLRFHLLKRLGKDIYGESADLPVACEAHGEDAVFWDKAQILFPVAAALSLATSISVGGSFFCPWDRVLLVLGASLALASAALQLIGLSTIRKTALFERTDQCVPHSLCFEIGFPFAVAFSSAVILCVSSMLFLIPVLCHPSTKRSVVAFNGGSKRKDNCAIELVTQERDSPPSSQQEGHEHQNATLQSVQINLVGHRTLPTRRSSDPQCFGSSCNDDPSIHRSSRQRTSSDCFPTAQIVTPQVSLV